MKIYTKTGDDGHTGLFGGARVKKDEIRVEAYGTVDELNAHLGVARSQGLPLELDAELVRIQSELFTVGAELACVPSHLDRLPMPLIGEDEIAHLERDIDAHEAHLPPLTTFILPAGSPAGAALHVARTVCRRAERRCLGVPEVRPALIVYLNRLSDYLFVLARRASHLAETPETPWRGRVHP